MEFVFLYGGSINSDNVIEHIDDECVDGVLVGGASVKADEIKSIVYKIDKFLT